MNLASLETNLPGVFGFGLVSARMLFVLGAMALAGCGGAAADAPPVAPVEGTVKWNGAPLAGVTVTYMPTDVAAGIATSPSLGITDDKGHYVLTFSAAQKGAIIGKHKVLLQKDSPVDDEEKPIPDAIVIPPRYNGDTKLIVTVPPNGLSGGEADFDLQFEKGEVKYQPAPGRK